ncbi:MAG: S8 family peptidase [Polyangiaceae bacterium]|nr:S8 family peptidase [Polyangiaceae bacterium]
MELRTTPAGVEIEKVLVFETIGQVEGFRKAASDLGLYWLKERDRNDIEPDNDFYDLKHRERSLTGRIYLACSNRRALGNLISLYGLYRTDPEPRREEHFKWYDLFKYLKDVRPWGPEDRLKDTGLAERWQERERYGDDHISVEIELWYRQDRHPASIESEVLETVSELGGKVTARSRIREIAYHAMIAVLPISAIEKLTTHRRVRLVQSDSVMFLRPVGQITAPNIEEDEPHREDDQSHVPSPAINPGDRGSPIVALLDGLPIENHRKLTGLLRVDDPDGWAEKYPATDRHHGTAMASLILHGELDAPGATLRRSLYVRPILSPDPNALCRQERIPDDVLAVDLLHRAVRRMFEGEGEELPVAPSVRIVNLSVGDSARPYYMYPSPWARMVDYLSYKYRALFVVSAGNHQSDIHLGLNHQSFSELCSDPSHLEAATLGAIRDQARNRRILSPAEAVNAITIGATHDDSSTWAPDGVRINPIMTRGLPSPVTPHGSGFQLAIKPEILFPGGRQTYRAVSEADPVALTLPSYPAREPGHRVAAPSASPGNLVHERYCRGTSNAAALATRAAAHIHEMLMDLRRDLGADGARIDDAHMAVLIKALLVHGAKWGAAADTLRRYFPAETLGEERHEIARWLGYGEVELTRVLGCMEHRATLIACDDILNDFAHVYRVPLPQSLNGKKTWRRVVVTLAWFTAINPFHEDYQRGDLWFTPYQIPSPTRPEKKEGEIGRLLKVQRTGVNWQSVRRGTVQHEILEGEAASVFDEDALCITVNCRDVAGDPGWIPYGLAVTVEVAESAVVPIYDDIRSRLQVKVRGAAQDE